MSLRNCFNRTTADCAADNKCILEYDPSSQNPACVPAVDTILRTTLSDTDLQTIRKIFIRLLPREGRGVTKRKFIRELNGLMADLKPRIDRKLRKLISEQRYDSWASLVTTVSNEIVSEINSECGICRERFNDPEETDEDFDDPENEGNTFIENDCCHQLFHRRCLRAWLNRPGLHAAECPICRDIRLDRVTLLPTFHDISAVRLFKELNQIILAGLGFPNEAIDFDFEPGRNLSRARQALIVIELIIYILVFRRLLPRLGIDIDRIIQHYP